GLGRSGDFDEHAARRTALVSLAGRMEETRAEPGDGRHSPGVPHRGPHRAERGFMRVAALDISEEPDIASRPQLVEQRLEQRGCIWGRLSGEKAQPPVAQDGLAPIELAGLL